MKKYIENLISVKSQHDLDTVRLNYMVRQTILLQCNCCGRPITKKLTKIKNKTFSDITCRFCSLENNLLEKHGVINVYQLESVKNKIKETCMKKNGVSHHLKLKKFQDKAKNTRYTNNNGKYKSIEEIAKTQKTFHDKYNAYGNYGRKSVKEKSENTQLKKYNSNYFIGTDKYKETMLELYNCVNPDYNEELFSSMHSKYKYNNRNFDSSWELAYYIWLTDHKINFEYHPRSISYYWIGDRKTHKYYPDFLINGKDYVEIKSPILYKRMKTDIGSLENAKYNRMVGLNVEIITDCTKYIDYIKATYSTNYLKEFKTR